MRIRGRLVSRSENQLRLAQGRTFRILEVAEALGSEARAGDIVALEVKDQVVIGIEILTPYRRRSPFPSPGAEFYRFHRDGLFERLEQRAACMGAVRTFFDSRQYLEVETPLRVLHPGLEPHLVVEPAAGGYFLITSPEYQMKRLLAAGFERIYTLCKCWRGDEVGPQHLPEFTMLEWYAAHTTTVDLMAETEALVRHVLGVLQTHPAASGHPLDLAQPFVRLSVKTACMKYGGVDLDRIDPDDEASSLHQQMQTADYGLPPEQEDFVSLFCRMMVERVEPALAAYPAVFLYDYPASLAALARLREPERRYADRFELYLGGVELANAFGELTDPVEQAQRLYADQEARQRLGVASFSLDERFLESLREGIPPTAGIALGVDRLLMVLTGATNLADCLAFPPQEL